MVLWYPQTLFRPLGNDFPRVPNEPCTPSSLCFDCRFVCMSMKNVHIFTENTLTIVSSMVRLPICTILNAVNFQSVFVEGTVKHGQIADNWTHSNKSHSVRQWLKLMVSRYDRWLKVIVSNIVLSSFHLLVPVVLTATLWVVGTNTTFSGWGTWGTENNLIGITSLVDQTRSRTWGRLTHLWTSEVDMNSQVNTSSWTLGDYGLSRVLGGCS